MDSDKSGKKDILGAYVSNRIGGQNLSTVILTCIFLGPLSLDVLYLRSFVVFLYLK